jgi:leucine dehydrogenase
MMLQTVEARTLKTPFGARSLILTDITPQAVGLPDFAGHERIWLGRDEQRGLTAIVAIHSTVLGPALGGTRIWPHPTFEAGLTDALRLSHGMTLKAAISGVPFGGGKAVILADPKTDKTPEMLDAYAEMLSALAGQYFTAEDVGLSLTDANYLGERAPNVTGTTRGGSGNPSPVTAHGVFLGLKAALKHRRGSDELSGVRVAVQGLGSVGWSLAEKLHAEGARLVVADIDSKRVTKAVGAFGAETSTPKTIVGADVDIFAPCALGGVISAETMPKLKAEIIAGAANNQLATDEDALRLMRLGILYAPDFVINAGGLMNVAAELAPGGYDRAATMAKVDEIPATLTAILERAKAEKRSTVDVAEAIAAERISAAAKH